MYSIEQHSQYKAALKRTLAQVVPADDLDDLAADVAQQLLLDEVDCSNSLLPLSLAELAELSIADVFGSVLQGYAQADSALYASFFLEHLHKETEPSPDKSRLSTTKRARRRAKTELATNTAVITSEANDELPPDCCELCERTMPLTVHHLIPKSEHSRLLSRQSASLTRSWLLSSENTAAVCRPCHTAIHRIMSNEHLAERGKTIEALCKDEDILKWITFARGQRTSDLKTGHHKGLKYRR